MKDLKSSDIEKIKKLKAGDHLFLSGTIYVARDRVLNEMEKKKIFPSFLKDSIIYHAGPTEKNEKGFLSFGPTTSKRMDRFLPFLFENGVIATIGKGERDVDIHKKYGKIYFLAFGGLGSLYGSKVKSIEPVLFKEFKSEALFRIDIDRFPLIVFIDKSGKTMIKQEK